jgi:phosphoglycolate phosphatase
MEIKHVIFDLDGTLVDSAPSIISTIKKVLNFHQINPAIKLDNSIVGPPISEIFQQLTESRDKKLIQSLVKSFILIYDSFGYTETIVFSEVPTLLSELTKKNISIHIATNKRQKPTKLILEHLGWTSIFKKVYTLDCVKPTYRNKSDMLTHLLLDIDNDPNNIIYVGDKNEDGIAANANSLLFLKASWGYETSSILENEKEWIVLDNPIDLLKDLMINWRN